MLILNTASIPPALPQHATGGQPTTRAASRPHGPTHAIRCPDMLALVAYDHAASTASPFVGTFNADFVKAIQGLPARVERGMTNLAAGLKLANDLLACQPKGLLRRIWLLTDGHPNPPDQPIWQEVERSRALHVNINTVGFGDPGAFDRSLLERIATATHRGRYAEASSLAVLSQIFRHSARQQNVGAHRGEATVFVIDVSGSMSESMGGRRRIDAVVDAMLDLIRYKQAMWS